MTQFSPGLFPSSTQYITPVKEDIVRGAQASQNLFETRQVRVFQVQGMSAFDANARPLIAINVNGVPRLGEAHPNSNFSSMIVVDHQTEVCDNPDVINVFVIYRWRNYLGSYLKSCGGSLEDVPKVLQTYNTQSKAMTTVTINYTTSGDTVTYSYTPIVRQNIISALFSFKFFETVDPEYFNGHYPGTINLNVWRGYPPRTLMILPINGTTQDNYWYDNTYTFRYKSDTYDQYAFYHTPQGVIPQDVARSVVYDGSAVSGNGWKRLQVLPMVDFNLIFRAIPTAGPDTYGLNYDAFVQRG